MNQRADPKIMRNPEERTWQIPRTLKVVNQRADFTKEGSRRKNVTDTMNVESRESEDRPHEGGVQKSGKTGPPVSWEVS